MTHIIDNIWLGDISDANNTLFLTNNNIKVIINCTKDFGSRNTTFNYRLPINDDLSIQSLVDMSGMLEQFVNIMEYHKENILVHCYAGRQRSATLVAAYIMRKYKMSYDDALKFIKSRRHVAFEPSPNFAKVLYTWN